MTTLGWIFFDGHWITAMIKAVLLDLDNTLLHNPDRQFADAFRQAFDAHFLDGFGRASLSPSFHSAIQILSRQRDMMTANAEVIIACLAQALQTSSEAVQKALTSFYQHPYDRLRQYAAVVPMAYQLVQTLLEQNLSVAIATNPIYSEAAILKRIDWAGLSDFVGDFAFVTHSENMHFSKPQPAYYAELVARIGIEPDETLMVGDSETHDVRPARILGIHTLHIQVLENLQAFYEQVQCEGWQNAYKPRPLNPSMIAPQYQGNLGALYGLLGEVKAHQWHQRPDPEEWSILQILCHLSESEIEVQQKRLRTILLEHNPFIASPPAPGPHIPPCHDEGYEVLNQFRSKRLATIKLLSQLKPEDWQRPARHSIFGLTNMLEMAYFTAQHDRLHITQLCQTLGKCDESIFYGNNR